MYTGKLADFTTRISYALLASALCSGLVAAEDWTIKGEARAPGSDELLYTEYHYLTNNGDTLLERRVDYLQPDGTRFARKVLTHDTDYQYVPSLNWQDYESETTITGQLNGTRYQQNINAPDRNETEVAQLPDPGNVAFDAAFDQYLIDHLPRLLDQGRLRFDFLSLGAGRTYSFQADVTEQGDGQAVIEVGPRSTVIRWFVDPIVLTYDTETERLTRFSGVTNFRREGDLINADIQYEYQ